MVARVEAVDTQSDDLLSQREHSLMWESLVEEVLKDLANLCLYLFVVAFKECEELINQRAVLQTVEAAMINGGLTYGI